MSDDDRQPNEPVAATYKPPTKLYAKIRRVREAVPSVTLVRTDSAPSDEGDPFDFAPAEDVFGACAGPLEKERLLVLPQLVAAEVSGGSARVTLAVLLVDASSGESLEQPWVGEAEAGIAGAVTAARKSFLRHTFDVRLEMPNTRHQQRAQTVREQPKVTPAQLKNFIGKEADKAGLNEGELLELARRVSGDSGLASMRHLLRQHVDSVVAEIRRRGG